MHYLQILWDKYSQDLHQALESLLHKLVTYSWLWPVHVSCHLVSKEMTLRDVFLHHCNNDFIC